MMSQQKPLLPLGLPLKKEKLDIPSLPDIVLPPLPLSPFSSTSLPHQLSGTAPTHHSTMEYTNNTNLSQNVRHQPHPPTNKPSSSSATTKLHDSSVKKEPSSSSISITKGASAAIGVTAPPPMMTQPKNAPLVITSKRTMPVMYTGRHKQQLSDFGAPRLMDLCLKVLMNNIDAIDEVGYLGYHELKPVIDKCNPMQLMRLESINPHLIEDTGHLWKAFCQKDFKLQCGEKDEDQTWCEYYVSLCSKRDHKLQQLKVKVYQNLIEAESPKKKTKYTSVQANPQNRRRSFHSSNNNNTAVSRPPHSMLRLDRPPNGVPVCAGVPASQPAKRSRTVEEVTVRIPSRAEILAKRGLTTLTDPDKFKTQPTHTHPQAKLLPVINASSAGSIKTHLMQKMPPCDVKKLVDPKKPSCTDTKTKGSNVTKSSRTQILGVPTPKPLTDQHRPAPSKISKTRDGPTSGNATLISSSRSTSSLPSSSYSDKSALSHSKTHSTKTTVPVSTGSTSVNTSKVSSKTSDSKVRKRIFPS